MESANNITYILRESVFFTARKARLPCKTEEVSGNSASSSGRAPSSSLYYSPRIDTLMERARKLGLSEVDTAIEASKDHWTEVEPEYRSAGDCFSGEDSSTSESERVSGVEGKTTEIDRELWEENLEAIRSFQREGPGSDFFKYGSVEYVLGRKIAEGGQASIYEVDRLMRADGEKIAVPNPVVLKVFKAGYSLLDLRKQWPLALLHKLNPSHENFLGGTLGHCNPIWNRRLLGDGRFAFKMERKWGDLRKLMDVRMQHNGNQHPPFMMSDGNYLECCMLQIMLQIADGMRDLHGEGTLHRDLKASNILIGSLPDYPKVDPVSLDHNVNCYVADFECSIGVAGTGYWRAPEILEAVKNRTWSSASNLFTPKSDVYSYGMTCYEIITGYIPFEDIEDVGRTSCDDVLQGKRPKLPGHLKPWMKELLCKCWHMDPSERPTFQEIVDVFYRIGSNDPNCQSESEFYKFHWVDSEAEEEED